MSDQSPYRVGFSGSRGYPRLDLVRASVRRLADWSAAHGRPVVVVSGTEPIPDRPKRDRVDERAIRTARELGLPTIVHAPDYDAHGRGAPLRRNGLIVRDSDAVVFFFDMKSRGTAHTLALALAAGKVGKVYGPDGGVIEIDVAGEMVRQILGR